MLRPLGRGSYGAVFEAVDPDTGQHVAVKELSRASGDHIARFKHEFRALADCHHPNLVGLKQLIEDDGRWLIVMELVPGSDFIEYVRPERDQLSQATTLPRAPAPANDNAPPFDERRLRGALAGIAEGLAALHGYGLMHRDLKPTNVRVRPDGRAVLLDFGLATRIDPALQSSRDMILGTVSYMAPEQAASADIGPPADLYALGVCLFEALTGELPFGGTRAVQVLRAKQEQDAPRASSRTRNVPPDLDDLCARLLDRNPAARPSPAEVIGACGSASQVGPWPVARGEETPFTGRDAELELLARALARTHMGEPRVVLLEGESGVGKTELVRAFVRRTRVSHPNLVTLRGRCYENEQVSYKAFDGCVDELAAYLQRQPADARARMLPVRAALLGQLFPVLRELREIESAPRDGISADPTARRLEAFGALAALLAKIAEERPLVLVIDDLHWADAESLRLLTALMQDAAAPPLLLVATLRPREDFEPAMRAHVERVVALRQASVIELFGLPQPDARTLARALLDTRVPDAWLTLIAKESQGNPLFIGELVRFAQRNDLGSRGSLSLEAALSARITALDAQARALLEAVALAARPHGILVFASALGHREIDEPLRRLLAEKLLTLRKGQLLACHNDRIRQAVLSLLPSSRHTRLHAELAAALSATPDGDSAEQGRHWELAGEPARAVDAYMAASTRALETLAFARAGELCARALSLLRNPQDPRTQVLTVRRAHALACAGMSGEAAELYREAAERAEGDERIRLRSHVAQQLMLSAQVAEGVAAARAVLRELGVSVPVGVLRLLVRYVYDRVLLTVRGMHGGGPVAASRRLAADVLSDLLHPISILHPLAYVILPLELLRLARGLPQHIAIGLTMRGWFHTSSGKLARALPLLAESRRILASTDAPVAAATQQYLEGSVRLAGFEHQRAAELLLAAHARLAELCPDRPWLVTNSRQQLLLAWYHVGRHDLLASTVVGWLAEARERNDSLSTALLAGMGHGFVHALMHDAPDDAQRELDAALARVPAEPFSVPHYGALMAMPPVLIYRGGASALHWLDRFAETHRDAFLMKTRACRETLQWMRGLALLRAAEGQTEATRAESIRTARRIGDRLERSRSLYARAVGALLVAQTLAFDRQHA
ncbi:MAG: protein kinase, partial [Polyangiales bacterium]